MRLCTDGFFFIYFALLMYPIRPEKVGTDRKIRQYYIDLLCINGPKEKIPSIPAQGQERLPGTLRGGKQPPETAKKTHEKENYSKKITAEEETKAQSNKFN